MGLGSSSQENLLNLIDRQGRRLRQELMAGAITLAGLFVVGTAWYRYVEDWTWLDAFYMTTITLATVGFGETHPLSPASRLFTILLILMGLLTIGYMVNRFTEAFIQGYFQDSLRRRQEQKVIERLADHYILCGYGRTGQQIAFEFAVENIPFVVIDASPEVIIQAKLRDYAVLQGDATLDEILLAAHIERAICIVSALSSDAENLYTVLSAKTLNPKIRAIARASSEEAVQKLKRAGADEVVSPYITGGKRLAAAALRPQVVSFVDGILTGADRSFYMEEFRIGAEDCPYIGQTLREAQLRAQSGALILAIRRQDRKLIVGPMGDTHLLDADSLICLGTVEQLRALNQLLCPLNPARVRLPKNHR
ncbi:potassium channel [Synechocystis sp. PCC 6803]|jgi:voltage-gated potassium channel|uniref:Potassium channel n=1 Tax=Synechocystis sp. (strain ATCC 27184 / PCC 6803 / Kazusa) TaxID=1111708 RepID=P73132_SYNY3|nr:MULTISPECIES: potassium channel protein [unclassified Synechocystis]BAM50877.1 potassium channel [Synechocystis sp. PCC 6803] [Bacillus subtilis BEST7613]AGF50848.1 potassium channel [Synechocystis sp. PCC 6803]AVP88742.1 potassium channel protein [Synechocystis sp. IPPAS B-1465]MBD2617250.1 NAD-binding protein [Synechocystis sp. FACHB-898]MBD2639682.1 NAD-binding protein [Synechocystis sp. FACHB-908]